VAISALKRRRLLQDLIFMYGGGVARERKTQWCLVRISGEYPSLD
jgi:hypothetical protein